MKRLALVIGLTLLILTLVAVTAHTQFDSPLLTPETPTDLPPPSGDETLKLVLLWLVGGVGAGIVAYWLIEHVGFLSGLPAEQKHYTALGLAACVACLAFVAAVGLGYEEDPGHWQAWLEQLFAIAYLAVTTNQALHGRLQLRSAG